MPLTSPGANLMRRVMVWLLGLEQLMTAVDYVDRMCTILSKS